MLSMPHWRDFSCLFLYSTLSLDSLRGLPEYAGVYCVNNTSKGLIYVGQTNNIKRRVCYHEKRKIFNENNPDSVYFYEIQSKADRLWIEYCLIHKYRPLLNRETQRKTLLKKNDFYSFNSETKESLSQEIKKLNNLQLHCLAREKMINTINTRYSRTKGKKEIQKLLTERLWQEKEIVGEIFILKSFLKVR